MDMISVGQQIKLSRERKGLTQEALAELLGLSTMHLSAIERGVKSPKLETFCRIALALDVSADILLQGTIPRTSDSLSSECSSLIAELPKEEQIRLIRCMKTYVASFLEFNQHS